MYEALSIWNNESQAIINLNLNWHCTSKCTPPLHAEVSWHLRWNRTVRSKIGEDRALLAYQFIIKITVVMFLRFVYASSMQFWECSRGIHLLVNPEVDTQIGTRWWLSTGCQQRVSGVNVGSKHSINSLPTEGDSARTLGVS